MVADINAWNERIITEFRNNSGYVRWRTEDDLAAGRPIPARLPAFQHCQGVPLILVHHTGIKTGRERINPMMYQPVSEGFAVFATYGGSPRHPVWYRNLIAHPRSTVEAGNETVPVLARVTEGAERTRIWARQVTLMPAFAEFETAAGRQIPVVVLERVQDHAPSWPFPQP